MRFLLRILAAFLVVGTTGFVTTNTSFTPDPQSALLLAGIEDACAGLCDGPPKASANVPITPTPCPACNQDEASWRQLTTVPPPFLLGKSAALIEGSCG